jgi:hypothetical protein
MSKFPKVRHRARGNTRPFRYNTSSPAQPSAQPAPIAVPAPLPVQVNVELKRDKVETRMLFFSLLVGAVAAVAAAYSAGKTAYQAEIARQAMTSGYTNTASETYIVAVGRLCRSFDESGGGYDVKLDIQDGNPSKLKVTAVRIQYIAVSGTNKTYDAAQKALWAKIVETRATAKQSLSESLDVMRMWYPQDKLPQLEKHASMALLLDDPNDFSKDNDRIADGLKRMGFCRYLQRQSISLLSGKMLDPSVDYNATEIEMPRYY